MPYRFIKPDEITENVTHIDLAKLKAKGIKGFIFDLDNTLMEPHDPNFHIREDVANWLSNIREQGFQSFILTNNKRLEYSRDAAAKLNMPFIHYAAKPNPDKFHEALSQMGINAGQVAVVGDRPLTDIWGGKRIGAYTVLVRPLKKESNLIKFFRKLEWLTIKHPKQ